MSTIFETPYFLVVVPTAPPVTRKDGGHIIIAPVSKIKDFTSLTPAQAIELIWLQMVVGEAMTQGLRERGINIGRINYQINGNWFPEFHLHLYGRAVDATVQKYGEALYLPKSNRYLYESNEPLTTEDTALIRKKIQELLLHEKYVGKAWSIC